LIVPRAPEFLQECLKIPWQDFQALLLPNSGVLDAPDHRRWIIDQKSDPNQHPIRSEVFTAYASIPTRSWQYPELIQVSVRMLCDSLNSLKDVTERLPITNVGEYDRGLRELFDDVVHLTKFGMHVEPYSLKPFRARFDVCPGVNREDREVCFVNSSDPGD
jgi:hypothetical protein